MSMKTVFWLIEDQKWLEILTKIFEMVAHKDLLDFDFELT